MTYGLIGHLTYANRLDERLLRLHSELTGPMWLLRHVSPRHAAPILTALAAGSAGTVLLFVLQWQSAERADRVRFASLQHFLQERLDDRVEKYESTLMLVREFFIANEVPSQEQWRGLVERLRLPINCSALLGLGYASRLAEQQFAAPGQPALHLAGPGTNAGGWPVLYWYAKEPLASPARGLDLRSSGFPWGVAESSANHDALYVVGRLPAGALASAFGPGRMGMVHTVLDATAPSPRPLGPGEDFSEYWSRLAAARMGHWQGALVAVIDMDQLLRDLLGNSTLEAAFEIFDGPDPAAAHRINERVALPSAADRSRRPTLANRVSTWPMYNERWSIVSYPTAEFERRSPRRIAWIVLAAGLAGTFCFTGLVWLQLQRRLTAESHARQLKEARDLIGVLSRQRERISRDLHDGLLQSLYALGLGLQKLRRAIRTQPAVAEERCQQNLDALELAMAEVRRHLAPSHPEPKPEMELGPALADLAGAMNRQGTIPVRLELEPGLRLRPLPGITLQLLQIAREAISNAQRHSGAGHIGVDLRRDHGGLRLRVQDDGCGFDQAAPRGHGLNNMRARAEEVGAQYDLRARPGEGVILTVYLPPAYCANPDAAEPACAASAVP